MASSPGMLGHPCLTYMGLVEYCSLICLNALFLSSETVLFPPLPPTCKDPAAAALQRLLFHRHSKGLDADSSAAMLTWHFPWEEIGVASCALERGHGSGKGLQGSVGRWDRPVQYQVKGKRLYFLSCVLLFPLCFCQHTHLSAGLAKVTPKEMSK